MLVAQIWTGNVARNFNYLIACGETGEATAIDPVDHHKCLAHAKNNDWRITQIVNTHEHSDHTSGNAAMIEATGARLLAHKKAGPLIKGIDRRLADGDVVRVGKSVELIAMDTPGHTMSHICLLSTTQPPALFSGDTLFNAGAGNCRRGGDPEALFHTFVMKISELCDDTQVFPGHDCLVKNLSFSLDREPNNERVRSLLRQLTDSYDPDKPLVTTMGLEREINMFLRLSSRAVMYGLQGAFPNMSKQPTPKEVFLKLRELRDHW